MKLQLEKAREATDEANLRAAYAECVTAALTETSTGNATYDPDTEIATATVESTQKEADWVSGDTVNIGGEDVSAKTNGDSWTITVTTDGEVDFN